MTVDSRIPLVEAVGITKRFGALVANDDINLAIHGGEVHAVLGENGAGKTTLTRIIYGLSQPDSGELRVGGAATRIASPKEAMAAGIGVVTQEFSLVGPMTVTENVMLAGVGLGAVDRRAARTAVQETADAARCRASTPTLASSSCRLASANAWRSSRRSITTVAC